ncbi:MAG TPA: hypothetical protein VLB50_00410 [Ignavibacteriaceae bacterium]|nr:hypothetical protein [Ignavibacteriaceae bacterium]
MKIIFIIVLILPFLIVSCDRKEKEEAEKIPERKFNSFIFVGMIKEKPGLYKYNTADKTYSSYWSSTDEEVVDFSASENQSSAFFITASKTGKEGIFPFIKDAKLYVISDDLSEPVFVFNIGSGLQIFSRWESELVFRIVINYWDKKVSTFINQTTIIFNTYGRNLQEESKIYDIIKDGYPRLPKIEPDLQSPSRQYRISYKGGIPDSVLLIRENDKTSFFITQTEKPVNEISWSDQRDFIIISTLDASPANTSIFTGNPNTSALYIYSVEKKELVNKWSGAGLKNFFTINDFVIFDDGFGRNSSIYIYNLQNNKVVKHITVKNGCGLRNIPEITGIGG